MAKSPLKYDRQMYNPQDLKGLTSKELRKEYSRLRDISQKRLKRLGESEFNKSQTYLYNKSRYIPLKQIKSDAQLRFYLTDLANFISAKRSTVSGARQVISDRIATLNERGYSFINKDNIVAFGNFMNYMKQTHLDAIYDSDQSAEFWNDYIEENPFVTQDKVIAEYNIWEKEQMEERRNWIVNLDRKE